MSNDCSDVVSKLGKILSDGYVIIDDFNLNDIWEHIPTSNEPDWQKESFSQYIKQSANSKQYINWETELRDIFDKNKLDFLRFTHNTTSGDARTLTQYPAARFIRMMRELDKIVHEQNVFNTYKSFIERPSSWPEISYLDGVVKQGNSSHKFTTQEYIEFFDLVWSSRRIVSPSKVIVIKEKPLSRKFIYDNTKIKNKSRLMSIITGIRKAMNDDSISLRAYSPTENSVFVEVCQK